MLLNKAVSLYVNEYLPIELRRHPWTVKCASVSLNKFVQDYSDYPLSRVTIWECRSFIRELSEKGLAATTINRYIGTLRGFFEYCILEEWIDKNPMARISHLKEEKRIVETLTKGELYRVINHRLPYRASRKKQWARDHLLMMLASSTGLRPSELAGIRWGDLNFEDQWVMVRAEVGKGRKERRIPLINETASLLYHKWKEDNPKPEDPLFIDIYHKRGITPTTINAIFKRILKSCGIIRFRKPTVYILRKSWVTHLYEDGLNINSIASLAGHENPATTWKYYIRNQNIIELRDEVFAKSFLNHTPKSQALKEYQKKAVKREGYVVKKDVGM